MNYNLLFFLLILLSRYSFSQILPSYHAVHHKPDLILHLDASNSSSLDPDDLTKWNDLSGSNNDFTIKNGSVTYSNEGGGSLEFDGNDYFCIDPISNFNSTNLTISLWIKVTNVTNRVGVLAQSSRTPTDITNEFQFLVKSSNGKLNFWDHDGSYGFGSTLSNNSTYETPNIWKYVTFTKDGTSGKYYINNSFDGSTTADHNVNYGLDWFCIGRDYRHDSSMPSGKSNRYGFEGYIAAVYIYSSTHSSDQITQNYNTTKSRYGH